MKYLPLNAAIFTSNRSRFVKEMKKNAIAIFVGNDEFPENGDALYKYKSNSDIFWLSGIRQEETMVILYPDNPDVNYREVLVLMRPEETKEIWDGKRLRASEATEISGCKTIVWLDALAPLLQMWIHSAENIYLNTNENDRKSTLLEVTTKQYRYIKETQAKYPLHQYYRSAPILRNLRAVKSALEIEVAKVAMDITEKAFRRVLEFVKPGVYEYEVEAEIVHTFLKNRATREGYNSIIASGDRARTLHYVFNNAECKDGELLLMDFGAEYGGYNADLTRTIPVNGKFTKRQKEVYNACLAIHRYCATILKPGITLVDYTNKVGDEATKQFLKLGLISKGDIKNEDPQNRAYRKYLYHGISHHLGIDVHDLGPRTTPLQAGMLLTIEPGIYIEEEQMGIRIENNFWLTKNGNKDLMKNIPIEANDIETLMKK